MTQVSVNVAIGSRLSDLIVTVSCVVTVVDSCRPFTRSAHKRHVYETSRRDGELSDVGREFLHFTCVHLMNSDDITLFTHVG